MIALGTEDMGGRFRLQKSMGWKKDILTQVTIVPEDVLMQQYGEVNRQCTMNPGASLSQASRV